MKAYPTTLLCEAMKVSRSGLYDYLSRYTSGERNRTETHLKEQIKKIFDQYKGTCGSRRMVKHLGAHGYPIGRYKVRRIMRELGLKAKMARRFKLTTDSKHSFPVSANILNRKFDVQAPNKVWTADITYVWTFEGWLYLSVVMDLYSRQIVGWAMNARMKKKLVLDALAMAYFQRKPPKDLLHHSDRGSQYACHDYQQQLKNYKMKGSMSRKGNCWDNAPTERYFRSLKSERLNDCRFLTREEAKNEILDYITFYNSIRIHSALGYVSPMAYEKEQYLKVA